MAFGMLGGCAGGRNWFLYGWVVGLGDVGGGSVGRVGEEVEAMEMGMSRHKE